MSSVLDPSRIPALLTPDTTSQIWQSTPEDQERALMVTTSADRITFFGFWSQSSASDGEAMQVTLTRVRDGVEAVIASVTYGVEQPHGGVIDYTTETIDPGIRPGDVVLVTRSYVPGNAPTMTRTMVVLKLGGWWSATSSAPTTSSD